MRDAAGPGRHRRCRSGWLCAALLLLLGSVSAGCRGDRGRGAPASASAGSALAPLRAPSWLVALDVPGFGSANVAVPLGARSPRPLVIALHGDADRPEWPCGSYHHASRARAIVLCPRGVPRPDSDRFTLGPVVDTARELRAALPALKARFDAHVAKGPVVLAALGPSVEHAIEIAREEPSFFSYLVLVDGSLARFTTPIMHRFAREGGKRVLFVCTRAGCDANVAGRALALRSMGVDTRVERLDRATALDATTVSALRKHWDWIVEGDARWR